MAQAPDVHCVIAAAGGIGSFLARCDRWVEMGGAGMVDPNVLRSVGCDPEEVTGSAFGLGIECSRTRRQQIDDIRLTFQNDARFLGQF